MLTASGCKGYRMVRTTHNACQLSPTNLPVVTPTH